MSEEEITNNADLTAGKQQRVIGRPFQKGESGNPSGRPVGSISITSAIKRKLQECPKGEERTYLDLLINRVLKGAVVDGNEQLIKAIWGYVDGMPKQKIGIGGDEDSNITKLTIEIVKNKDQINGGDKIENNNGI